MDHILAEKGAFALQKLEEIEAQLRKQKGLSGSIEEVRIIQAYDKFTNRFLSITTHLGMSPNARDKLKWIETRKIQA